jgi:hypothetical protein
LHQINTYFPQEQKGIKDMALFQSASIGRNRVLLEKRLTLHSMKKQRPLFESLAKIIRSKTPTNGRLLQVFIYFSKKMDYN